MVMKIKINRFKTLLEHIFQRVYRLKKRSPKLIHSKICNLPYKNNHTNYSYEKEGSL